MTSDNNMQKKCGFCGESIPVGAGRCPYCGSILEVTFDDSYKINQSEVQPIGGETAGQTNAEQQQTGQDADKDLSTTEAQNNEGQQGNAEPTSGISPENGQSRQIGYSAQMHNAYRPYGSGAPNYNYSSGVKEPLSNGMKVFLTVLFTVLPGIGQLAGIIAAIVFMNSEGDSDRKSFGVALLVASLIMFVISCIGCFVFVIAFSSNQLNY